MLRYIYGFAKKEIFSNLYSVRFIFTMDLICLLFLASSFMMLNDYRNRRENYIAKRRVHHDNLVEILNNDNTIIGLDFTCMPGWKTNFYGQLIVDDFQIDDEAQGDKEPNEIGFMLGIFRTGKIASLIPDVKLEYVRLTNRTYHQRDPRNRYLYRNKPLGHPQICSPPL